MGLETFGYIDDLVATNPTGSDNKSQGDNHLRGIKETLQSTFPSASRAVYFNHTGAISGDYPIVAADENDLLLVDASGAPVTVSLPSIAALPDGFEITVKKIDASANAVIIDPAGTNTIDGAATVTLDVRYDFVTIVLSKTGSSVYHIKATNRASLLAYPGTLVPYAGTTAPSTVGALLCAGQAISRTTYAKLFAAVGTTWGIGNGSTTFNIPDLRGRVVAGQDDMGGTSANRLTGLTGGLNGDVLGSTGGAEGHVLTEVQLAAHTHPAGNLDASTNHSHSLGTSGQAFAAGVSDTEYTSGTRVLRSGQSPAVATVATTNASTGAGSPTTNSVTGTTSSTGGNAAHNNVQPTAIANYLIMTGL